MSRLPSLAARLVLTTLPMLGLLGGGVAFAAKSVGSVHFTLGGKRMSSDWYVGAPRTGSPGDTLAPRASQPAIGVELTWGREGWPALIALDVLHSYDDGVQRYPANQLFQIPRTDVRRRVRTLEIGLGARRSWNVKGFSPHLGAGGSWVRGHFAFEMSNPDQGAYGAPGPRIGDKRTTLGFWVGGGLYRPLGPRLQIGLAGRYSKAKLTFSEWSQVRGEQGGYVFVPDANEVEAGGSHIGVAVGWSFPRRP